MFGGFRALTGIDAFMSRDLFDKYQNPPPVRRKARPKLLAHRVVADCGIGRISHSILTDYFKELDFIDPVELFLTAALENLKNDSAGIQTFNS
jgi:hypothetical protein